MSYFTKKIKTIEFGEPGEKFRTPIYVTLGYKKGVHTIIRSYYHPKKESKTSRISKLT